MEKKRLLLIIIASLFLLSFSFTRLVQATGTDTVTATVTAQNISVSVDNASISFGTIATNTTKDTTTGGVNDSSTATNDGNVVENFNIKTGNSTNWTLAATAGSEQYTMKSCAVADCDGAPTWVAVGIDPSYATLASNVAVSGTQVFDLQVGTPTSTASFGEQTITITIQAALPS